MDLSSASSTFREAMRRQRSWIGWSVGVLGDVGLENCRNEVL